MLLNGGHSTTLFELYARHKHNPRPTTKYWLVLELRKSGAVRCHETCTMLPQNDIGFRQFLCDDPNKRYPDPPVVTLYENGTWERV
jgi:hypothetical protein